MLRIADSGRTNEALRQSAAWRQVTHLFLGDVEPDSGIEPGHGADRDGYVLAPPKVAFPKQYMGYPVILWVDEKATHPPDLAIGGMDTIPGSHLVFTQRNDVLDDRAPAVWH